MTMLKLNIGAKLMVLSAWVKTFSPLRRIAYFITLFLLVSVASADAGDSFTTLRSASTSTDLPLGGSGAGQGGGLPGTLRPDLTYPTLDLDHKDPREMQEPERRDEGRDHTPTLTLTPTLLPKPEPAEKIVETPFQKMVKQTLGYSIPVFGASLFKANVRGFEPIDQASVPADFVLATGDEINIHAWGSIELDYRTTIDRRGAIHIPKVGEIFLAGVRFADVEQHVRVAIERSYKSFDLSVSLGQLRAVRVYVTGFAKSPGSYTVNSLSTMVNVLFHAGGPDQAGNLRKVELHRSGQLIATVDLYDFLLHGSAVRDVRVMPDDVIHIPAMEGEVAIAGAVNRSGIYQLGQSETLHNLLRHAGNLSVLADDHRVVIERIRSTGERVVIEVSLAEVLNNLVLKQGDLVLISAVSPEFKNAITLRGHVATPLRHAWKEGMRVSDLIPGPDALISPEYWIRRNTQNQVIDVLSGRPATRPEVNFPSINWEYAVVERVNKNTMLKELHPFELDKAIFERDPGHNLALLPGDHVTIYSLQDFRTRTAQNPRYVQIEGEVQNAGYYEALPSDTITDLIAKAGGLTTESYLYGLELKRVGIKAKQQERIRDSIDQLERDYYRHLISRSRNVVSGEMTTAIVPEAAAIIGLIENLREAQPNGRVVLELPENTRTLKNIPDLVLADGDSIYIPPVPATVEVVGAVFRQGSFIHNHEHPVDYLDRAGLLPTADKRSVYVVRPDGTFTIAHRRVRIQPGDTIIVPEMVDRETSVRRIKDWTQVLYQFGLGAAGLSVLGLF